MSRSILSQTKVAFFEPSMKKTYRWNKPCIIRRRIAVLIETKFSLFLRISLLWEPIYQPTTSHDGSSRIKAFVNECLYSVLKIPKNLKALFEDDPCPTCSLQSGDCCRPPCFQNTARDLQCKPCVRLDPSGLLVSRTTTTGPLSVARWV